MWEITKIVELALKILAETKQGKKVVKNSHINNLYKEIVKHFVSSGNQESECDIKNITESKYAFPMRLLAELECKITISWTGFVLEMNDGKLFQYGTTWLVEFFELPKNYSFNDAAKLHNHSDINSQGELQSLPNGFSKPLQDDELSKLYREKEKSHVLFVIPIFINE